MKPIKIEFTKCARCHKIIPDEVPYVCGELVGGQHDGQKIPSKGVLCEACFAEAGQELPPGVVLLATVYH